MVSYKRMNDTMNTADSLLAAAKQLFAERGFDGSSVRDITAQAGANLGAVTYHFGSKEALYQAVLDRALVPFRTTLAETAAAPGPPLDRIAAVLRALFQHLADHPDIQVCVLAPLGVRLDCQKQGPYLRGRSRGSPRPGYSFYRA